MKTNPRTHHPLLKSVRCVLLGVAVLTGCGLPLTKAQAQTAVPLLVNYQGAVTDSTGTPLGNAAPVNRKILFRFWDATTAGTRLWTEEQTVTISQGQFSVLLGQGIAATGTAAGESRPALDTVFGGTGNDRYLGITVDNGDNNITVADTEITPRQRITSTAYALRARVADAVALASDLQLGGSANYGLGWYGTGRTFNGHAVNGPVLYGQGGGLLGAVNGATQTPVMRWNEFGQVGIGTTSLQGAGGTTRLTLQGDDTNAPPLQLNIRGNTDNNKRLLVGYNTTGNYGAIQAYSGASTTTTLLLNQVGGNVGIGVSSSSMALEVNGAIGAAGASGHVFRTGGDTDGGLFSPGDGIVTLRTNSTERLRVDANGNIGIGLTTVVAPLDISRPSNGHTLNLNNTSGENGIAGTACFRNGTMMAQMAYMGTTNLLGYAGGGDVLIGSYNGADLRFDASANGSENMRMIIKADTGNVGIGVTVPLQKLHVVGQGVFASSSAVSDPGGAIGPAVHVGFNTAGDYGYINSVYTGVAPKNLALQPTFGNVGIGTTTPASRLVVQGDASATTDQIRIQGASNPNKQLQISFNTVNNFAVLQSLEAGVSGRPLVLNPGLDGNVGIGTGTTTPGAKLHIKASDSSRNSGLRLERSGSTDRWNMHVDSSTSLIFSFNDQFPSVNYCYLNPSQAGLISVSDRRTKKNIRTLEDCLSKVMQLRPTTFLYKSAPDGSARNYGFIAQEVETVFPDIVLEQEGLKTLATNSLIAINTQAIQQLKKEKDAEIQALQRKNAELTARLEALEAKDKARDAKLAAIEKLLLANDKPAAQPVSLKRGGGGSE